MSMIGRLWRRFRDAMTGRFVSKEYAKKHPDVTVGETVRSDPVKLAEACKREGGL